MLMYTDYTAIKWNKPRIGKKYNNNLCLHQPSTTDANSATSRSLAGLGADFPSKWLQPAARFSGSDARATNTTSKEASDYDH